MESKHTPVSVDINAALSPRPYIRLRIFRLCVLPYRFLLPQSLTDFQLCNGHSQQHSHITIKEGIMHAQLPSLRPHLATLLLSQITALQFFCSVLLCTGALMAFGPVLGAQTLPVVGQVLWKIDYPTGSPTGAIAYAPTSDLVFAGLFNGFFLVVQGATGNILDTVWTDTWRLRPEGQPLRAISDLSCSADGSVIAITAYNYNSGESKVVLMEYPSKRILMDSLYVGLNEEWRNFRIKVSPSGRYVVVPNPGLVNGMRLHDRQRDTMYVLDNGFSYPDFDDAERTMVYGTHGFIEGTTQEFGNRVSVLSLNEFPLTPRHLKEYGRSSISSDGRYLMMSGYGIEYSFANPAILGGPRSSVYDMQTDSLIWRIHGDLSGFNDWDLTRHQWSKDATKLFAIRDSEKVPADWRLKGVLYNVGDSVPYARICNDCRLTTEWSENRGSIGNPELTVAFYSGLGFLMASSLTPTTSVKDLSGEGSGIVYPNPTTGEVRMQCANAGIATSWALVSINGQQLANGVLTTVAGGAQGMDATYSIILSKELPRGTYLLSLLAQRGPALCTQKVVLQ